MPTTPPNNPTDDHSSGPWIIDWKIAGGPQTHEDIPTLHYVNIHSPRYYETAPDGMSITGYLRKPDIHLIAAAPDLLALARQYASECARCGGSAEIIVNESDGDPIDDEAIPCNECADIWEVINKAEGRS